VGLDSLCGSGCGWWKKNGKDGTSGKRSENQRVWAVVGFPHLFHANLRAKTLQPLVVIQPTNSLPENSLTGWFDIQVQHVWPQKFLIRETESEYRSAAGNNPFPLPFFPLIGWFNWHQWWNYSRMQRAPMSLKTIRLFSSYRFYFLYAEMFTIRLVSRNDPVRNIKWWKISHTFCPSEKDSRPVFLLLEL